MGPLLSLLRTIPVFPEWLSQFTSVAMDNVNLLMKDVFSVCLEEFTQVLQVLTQLDLLLLSVLLICRAHTLFPAMCKLFGCNLYNLPHPLQWYVCT